MHQAIMVCSLLASQCVYHLQFTIHYIAEGSLRTWTALRRSIIGPYRKRSQSYLHSALMLITLSKRRPLWRLLSSVVSPIVAASPAHMCKQSGMSKGLMPGTVGQERAILCLWQVHPC